MKRYGLFGMLLMMMVASPGLADDASTNANLDMQFGRHAEFRKVFDALKADVANPNASRLAKAMNFPLNVRTAGRKLTIKSSKAFIANYSAIMRPSIVKAIESATYGELFVNYQGAMIGQGEVWIGSRCVDKACSRSKVGVITIQEIEP